MNEKITIERPGSEPVIVEIENGMFHLKDKMYLFTDYDELIQIVTNDGRGIQEAKSEKDEKEQPESRGSSEKEAN